MGMNDVIGVLAAILTWEVEHVGSILLSLAITSIGVLVSLGSFAVTLWALWVRFFTDDAKVLTTARLAEAGVDSPRADAEHRLHALLIQRLQNGPRLPKPSLRPENEQSMAQFSCDHPYMVCQQLLPLLQALHLREYGLAAEFPRLVLFTGPYQREEPECILLPGHIGILKHLYVLFRAQVTFLDKCQLFLS